MRKSASFFAIAAALICVTASGKQINLGCNAKGPLAALTASTEFRDAIGANNPANYLSAVYDANGQRLASTAISSMHCPLFVDSDAEPSPSESRAILRGGHVVVARRAPAAPVRQTAAPPVEAASVVISSSSGVVMEIPQALQTVELPAAPPEPAQRVAVAAARRTVRPVSEKHVAKAAVRTEAPVAPAVAAPAPAQQVAQVAAAQQVAAPQQIKVQPAADKQSRAKAAVATAFHISQEDRNPVLRSAIALHLVRRATDNSGAVSYHFNAAIIVLSFLLLFASVMLIAMFVIPAQDPARSVHYRVPPPEAAFRRYEPSQVRRDQHPAAPPRRRANSSPTWVAGD